MCAVTIVNNYITLLEKAQKLYTNGVPKYLNKYWNDAEKLKNQYSFLFIRIESVF